MRSMTCPECSGTRLNARARAVKVGGRTLVELGAMPIGEVARFFNALSEVTPGDNSSSINVVPLDAVSRTIGEELLKEIRAQAHIFD